MTWPAFAVDWHWRPDVVVVLGAVSLLYTSGWVNLRRQGWAHVATVWRLAATLMGWGVVGLALVSPLDAFQRLHLSVHMVQHELLLVVAPPLVLSGHPLPVALWALPDGARSWAGRLIGPRAPLRHALDLLTSPLPAWAASTAILWIWHLPVAYDAVESNGMLHNAQHLCFFAAGLIFWWPVIAAPPVSRRLSLPVLAAYLVAGMIQRSLLGALITLSDHVLYLHYNELPGITATSALGDQHVAGAIMWFGSGLVLLAVTLIFIWRAPDGSPASERFRCGG